jgi:hypothetical protein
MQQSEALLKTPKRKSIDWRRQYPVPQQDPPSHHNKSETNMKKYNSKQSRKPG